MYQIVYNLSEVERKEIEDLFEKKVALENLSKIVDPGQNEPMYQRLLSDYGKVSIEFQNWWNRMLQENAIPKGNYSVDFNISAIISTDSEE